MNHPRIEPTRKKLADLPTRRVLPDSLDLRVEERAIELQENSSARFILAKRAAGEVVACQARPAPAELETSTTRL